MWADAKRDGCPVEYRWRRLRKFRNSIPCIPCRKVCLTPTGRVPCINAANTGEPKTWGKVKFAPGKIPSGSKSPRKLYIRCTSLGDGQTSCKVWLASGKGRRCSNEAKTRNQTRQPISAVSGPKFATLRAHLEEILLFNRFLSDCRYMT